MNFESLTKTQANHLADLIDQYGEVPEGCTHVDENDKSMNAFMKFDDGDWYHYSEMHDNEGGWILWAYNGECERFYKLPSYNPEELPSKVYIIDVESINEVSELIKQNNPYRTGESLHSIRKGIWKMIKQAVSEDFEMLSTGGATVLKSYGEDGVMDISVMYNPCRDHKCVTMTEEELEDV